MAADAGRQPKISAASEGGRRPLQVRPARLRELETVLNSGSVGPDVRVLPARCPVTLFMFLYADCTVAGLYRVAFTVPEVVEDLDGVLRRAPLEVQVVQEICLVVVLGTQK